MRILATDIGGTHLRAAILESRDGTWDVGPVKDSRTPHSLDEVLATLQPLARETEGIAIGVAGSVREHRRVLESGNIPFIQKQAVDIGGIVSEKLGKPCLVFNDMEAALAGELVAGTLRGCRWAFMDTVSTGWGGALLLNGEIVAAEPGHTPSGLLENRRDAYGHVDCNEAHFSGSQVEDRVRHILKQKKIPVPQDRSPNVLADEAVQRGEPWAVELYRYIAEGIGRAWVYRLNLIPRIEKIAYQGGFLIPAMELPVFRDALRDTIRTWTMYPETHTDIPIERARADHGALLGAAHLFRSSKSS